MDGIQFTQRDEARVQSQALSFRDCARLEEFILYGTYQTMKATELKGHEQ